MPGGLKRAKADLERGDARQARERLKSLLVTSPHDLQIRSLLAEAYRRDRHFPEAGRWGYLIGPAATEREREAFERHAAFGWDTRIKRSRLRFLLRTDDLDAIADAQGRERLKTLSTRRRPGSPDSAVASLARWLPGRLRRRGPTANEPG